jgi:hypothetical protein
MRPKQGLPAGDNQKNSRKLSAIEATGLTFVFLSLALSKSIIFILTKNIS